MIGSVLATSPAGPFPGKRWMFFVSYALGYAAVGLAYPIALLIVLRTRRVRAYYQSVGEGR